MKELRKEDNRILELALASGSVLIVAADVHLLDMSPSRGVPNVGPAAFAARLDACDSDSGRCWSSIIVGSRPRKYPPSGWSVQRTGEREAP
jgi:hypothetical protein